MTDALENPTATLALHAQENTTFLVCGQCVVASPEDDCEEEVKAFFVGEIDRED